MVDDLLYNNFMQVHISRTVRSAVTKGGSGGIFQLQYSAFKYKYLKRVRVSLHSNINLQSPLGLLSKKQKIMVEKLIKRKRSREIE